MAKSDSKDRVLSAIVGSYPKPNYVLPHTGRQLLDSFGFAFENRRREVGDAEFEKLLDLAVTEALDEQLSAGLDLITDGEERRSHYAVHIITRLGGVDSKNLKRVSFRGGTDEQDVPRVVEKISYKGPIVLGEYEYARSRAGDDKTIKIGLPGPSTVVDCVADDYYQGDKQQLAVDYADAIRQEVAGLIQAGCKVIQFDDPVLLRHPQHAKEWGLRALERCFSGLEDNATFIVHICCGYPNKPFEAKGIAYKADKEYYNDVLRWLAKSKIDVISIEGAQSNLDASVLSAAGEKTVMLGVLDVGDERVETVEELVDRGHEALRYIPKGQLILAPDCGLLTISRQAAKTKLTNLAAAVDLLNRE
jgi:5-methyltetrahydropteroyltriglutamate--homocysteine methyltransferase